MLDSQFNNTFNSELSPVDNLNAIKQFFEQNNITKFIHPTAKVHPMAVLEDFVYVGENATIRPFAYLRSYSIIGSGSIVGQSAEIKNALLVRNCQVSHLNYVGDSILGENAHVAAGSVLSNVKLNGRSVLLQFRGARYDTGLMKLGSILGKDVEIGCNSVANPGTVFAEGVKVGPLRNVAGYVDQSLL